MARKALIVLVAAVVCSGLVCAPAADTCLSVTEVTGIPDGNASGSGFSGEYVIVSGYGDSCNTCSRNEVRGFCSLWTLTLTEGTVVTVTQNNGRITFQDASTSATGGVDANGSFAIGSIVPFTDNDSGKTIGQVLVLMTGQFVDDRIIANARMHMTGNTADGFVDAEVVNVVTYQRSQP